MGKQQTSIGKSYRVDELKKVSWHSEGESRKQRTIQEIKNYANLKKGHCLSKRYQRNSVKLKWQCEEGHQWRATASSVLNTGTWCPICNGPRSILLSDLRKIAKARGGKCLAKKYKNAKTKVAWECPLGHRFHKSWDKIRGGAWCPFCSEGFGESVCRATFEHLFGQSFKRIRPPWLVNPEGNYLELDGYNENLKIAFEHQGGQHFKEIRFFHKDNILYQKRIRDDKIKKQVCAEKGIRLIEVPEIPRTVLIENVSSFIISSCTKLGIKVPHRGGLDLSKIYRSANQRIVDDLNEIAKSKGGKLISQSYLGDSTKLKWSCFSGHVFEMRPNHVKRGHWCSHCVNRNLNIDHCIRLAESKRGKCLSINYIDARTPLKWACEFGHSWNTPLYNITAGSWCPRCASQRRGDAKRGSLLECQQIASQRGGKCISRKYHTARTSMKWECKEGHRWSAVFYSVKGGTWCRICSIKRVIDAQRLTIGEMQEAAKVFGGECLSKKYINYQTKLKWKCKNGHTFMAKPSHILDGHFCRKCGFKKTADSKKQRIQKESGESKIALTMLSRTVGNV